MFKSFDINIFENIYEMVINKTSSQPTKTRYVGITSDLKNK